jgi:hypothetical protein
MRTYSSIESEFRRHFGEASSFSWCDFRPHFDGHLINASVVILPLASAKETRDKAWNEFGRIWLWLRDWAACFDEGDGVQVVVGFPGGRKLSGQMFRGSIKVKELSKLLEDFNTETLVQCVGGFFELVDWSRYSQPQPNRDEPPRN